MEGNLSESRVASWDAAYADYSGVKKWIGKNYPFGCWTIIGTDDSLPEPHVPSFQDDGEARHSTDHEPAACCLHKFPEPSSSLKLLHSRGSPICVNTVGTRRRTDPRFDVALFTDPTPNPWLQPSTVRVRCRFHGVLGAEEILILSVTRFDADGEVLSVVPDGESAIRNCSRIEFHALRDTVGPVAAGSEYSQGTADAAHRKGATHHHDPHRGFRQRLVRMAATDDIHSADRDPSAFVEGDVDDVVERVEQNASPQTGARAAEPHDPSVTSVAKPGPKPVSTSFRFTSASERNSAVLRGAERLPKLRLAAYVRHISKTNYVLSTKIIAECNRVEAFYVQHTNVWTRELFRLVNMINEEIATMRVRRPGASGSAGRPASSRNADAVMPTDAFDPHEEATSRLTLDEHAALRSTLMDALRRVYFAYCLLLRFVEQNSECVAHLITKTEKRSQQCLLVPFESYLKDHYYFYVVVRGRHPINDLLDFIEERYMEINGGDKKGASRALHVADEKVASKNRLLNACLSGVLFGIAFGCIILSFLEQDVLGGGAVVITTFTADNTMALNLLYLSGIPILLAVLFSINVVAWDVWRVNYMFIFELDVRSRVDGFTMMRTTMKYAVVWSAGFFVYVRFHAVDALVHRTWIVSVAVLGAVGLMLAFDTGYLPLTHKFWALVSRIQQYRLLRRTADVADEDGSASRGGEPSAEDSVSAVYDAQTTDDLVFLDGGWWLLRALGHILVAPFCVVSFSDFFVADLLTSLTGIFGLVQTILTTLSGSNFSWPVLASLPHVWRLLQCLRRWYDGPGWSTLHPNFTNAVKYSVGIFQIYASVYFSKALHSAQGDVSQAKFPLGLWITGAVVEFVYKTSWDLYMDVGMFQAPRHWKRDGESNPHPMLRRRIMYPEAAYWTFAVVDVALRFTTLLRIAFILSANPLAHLNSSVWWTVEVFRRFLWVFFRVENEQVSNTERYRAVDLLPPSWDDSEHETVSNMDAQFASLWRSNPSSELPPKRLLFDRLPLHHKHSALNALLSQRFLTDQASAAWSWDHATALRVFRELHDEDQVRVLYYAIGNETVASFLARFPAESKDEVQSLPANISFAAKATQECSGSEMVQIEGGTVMVESDGEDARPEPSG